MAEIRIEIEETEIEEINKALEKFAVDVINEAKRNIVKQDAIASGQLLKSAYVIRKDDDTIEFGFDAPWAGYIEFGTSSRQKMPPVEAIKKWLEEKGSHIIKRVRRGGKYYVQYWKEGKILTGRKWPPTKPKRPNVDDIDRAAWAIAKAIQKKGTKPKPFFRPAIMKVMQKFGGGSGGIM